MKKCFVLEPDVFDGNTDGFGINRNGGTHFETKRYCRPISKLQS